MASTSSFIYLRFLRLTAAVVGLSCLLLGCGGGSGGGSTTPPAQSSQQPQNPPPTTPTTPNPPNPPSTNDAVRWEVSLATTNTCFKPQSQLPLSIAVFRKNGDQIVDPRFTVTSDVADAVVPDGNGGWLLQGEGAARVTVSYTDPVESGSTLAPMVFDVLRDGTAPVIDIASPARAAMVISDTNVRVQGLATDATSTVQSLTVNGIEQVGSAAASRAIDVTPEGRWGLNVIDVTAVDSCGNTAKRSQSYLRSAAYRAAATAAATGARIPRAQTLKLAQVAIDDGDRGDLDDFATLVERFLDHNLDDVLSQSTSNLTVVEQVAGCPGIGYRVSIGSAGVSVVGPSVRELELRNGGLGQGVDLNDVLVPLRVEYTVRAGIPLTGCLETGQSATATFRADVTTNSVSNVAASNGRIDVTIPSIDVALSDVRVSLTNVLVIDNVLSDVTAALIGSVEAQIASALRDTLPPLIEAVLNEPLTLSGRLPAGPFTVTMNAAGGVDGVTISPNGFVPTVHTQVYPASAAQSSTALGAIARPTAAAVLTASPGPATYAIDDNLLNQGLWALWHGGAMNIDDVVGFGGIKLGVAALLPPVIMPGTQPGLLQLGLGDLDVSLSLELAPNVLPLTDGRVEVDAYVSMVFEGSIGYERATRSLRFNQVPDGSRVHLQVKEIRGHENDIGDASKVAAIKEYAEGVISSSITQLADATLIAAVLPPERLVFDEAIVGGTVDAVSWRINALSRTADHIVVDMSLFADGAAGSDQTAVLTLNVPWNAQDVRDQRIPPLYEDQITHLEDSDHRYVPSRSTSVRAYHERLAQCEQDGSTVCVADWKFPLAYGYFCGKGRPVGGFRSELPLDPVDYCCVLHDQNLFGPDAPQPVYNAPQNACGFTMCLNEATESSTDVLSSMPGVARARQQMYSMAKLLCGNVPAKLDLPRLLQPD